MSIVQKAIEDELNEAMKLSTEYSSLIKSAKTKTKKEYYSKKIKQNNNKIADLLMAHQKLALKGGSK